MDELVKTMLNDIDRIKAENEKLKAENQKQKEILNRLSQTKVNHQIKNPFAFTSGLCCHHCDHKDEYIIELEEENEELKKMLKLAVEEIERNRHPADAHPIRSRGKEVSEVVMQSQPVKLPNERNKLIDS